MDNRQSTVFVVDDDEQSLRHCDAVLRHAGWTTQLFLCARAFLDSYDYSRPACLLLDVMMPDMNGLELQQELNRRGATIPIIFVTGVIDVPTIVEALKDGAFDYLEKPLNPSELLDRVRRAIEVDARIDAGLRERRGAEQRLRGLSVREVEILDLIVEGRSNKEVALRLDLSSRTVESHRASLIRKLGARNTAHVVRMALELRMALHNQHQ